MYAIQFAYVRICIPTHCNVQIHMYIRKKSNVRYLIVMDAIQNSWLISLKIKIDWIILTQNSIHGYSDMCVCMYSRCLSEWTNQNSIQMNNFYKCFATCLDIKEKFKRITLYGAKCFHFSSERNFLLWDFTLCY